MESKNNNTNQKEKKKKTKLIDTENRFVVAKGGLQVVEVGELFFLFK